MAKIKRQAEDILQRFKEARVYDQDRFERYKENQAFYEGAEDLLPSYNPDKIWTHNINVPYAAMNVIKVVSSLQSQDFKGLLIPYDSTITDVMDKLNKVIQDVWKEADIDQEVNDAIERCAVLREHYTHIVFNENDEHRNGGFIKAYPLNPAAVVIDPNAKGLNDADYVFVAEKLTHNKVKDLYPKKFNEIAKKSRDLNQQETGEHAFVNAQSPTGKDYTETATRLTMYEKLGGTVYMTVTVNGVVVQETIDLEINNIPIAQLRWQPKMNSPYGISLIEKMIPSQKAVNEIESATANAALMFSSPSFIVNTASGIDPEDLATVANMPSAVIGVDASFTGNTIRDIVLPLLPSRNIDNSLLEIRAQQIQTIREIAGVSKEFEGELGTAGNTAGGAADALSRAKISEERFKQQLARYIERLVRIISDIVVKDYRPVSETYYTKVKTNENGSMVSEAIDLSDIDVDKYRKSAFGFYTNLDNLGGNGRLESYQKLVELMQLERQYSGSQEDYESSIKVYDLVRMLEFEGKDEILERMVQKEVLSTEKISEMVVELTTVAIEYGVDQELLNAAIKEIISRDSRLEAFNQVMEMVDQAAEQMALQEQMMLEEDQAEITQQLQMEEQMMMEQQAAQQQEQESMMAARQELVPEQLADMEIELGGDEMGMSPEDELADMEFELEG